MTTNDEEYEALLDVRADEIINEVNRQKEILKALQLDRQKNVRIAYMKLPPPSEYIEGETYRVPCLPEHGFLRLVTEKDLDPCGNFDYYEFLKRNGRWVMTDEEFNRHIYRGAYI